MTLPGPVGLPDSPPSTAIEERPPRNRRLWWAVAVALALLWPTVTALLAGASGHFWDRSIAATGNGNAWGNFYGAFSVMSAAAALLCGLFSWMLIVAAVYRALLEDDQ